MRGPFTSIKCSRPTWAKEAGNTHLMCVLLRKPRARSLKALRVESTEPVLGAIVTELTHMQNTQFSKLGFRNYLAVKLTGVCVCVCVLFYNS